MCILRFCVTKVFVCYMFIYKEVFVCNMFIYKEVFLSSFGQGYLNTPNDVSVVW